MKDKKNILAIIILVLSIIGIGLSFLTIIQWYLGFIATFIGMLGIILFVCLYRNRNDSLSKAVLYVSLVTLILSFVMIGNYATREFVTTTFEYSGKTYQYSDASISLFLFVALIALFIWDKLPMATTAIAGCVLMVAFGLCKFSVAFGQFASSTVILTIGVMVIGAAISETGLARVIGNWIIKISKGKEIALIVGTYLVSALMSAFLTNSAVLAIFIPIIVGLSKSSENIKAKNLIMPIAMGCVLGGASTLVGSTQQMTAQGLLEEAGFKTFKTFDFSLVGGIIVLAGLLYIILWGYRRGKKIWGNRPDDESEEKAETKEVEKPKWKMIVVASIFLCTVVLYITEWLPIAIVSSGAAVLCIITTCIDQKKAITSVNWNIVGRLAGCLGIAKALEASGGTALIAKGFIAAFGNSVSPFLLFAVAVLLTLVLSQFISNSTAILIVLPIILSVAPELGLNAYAFALGITLASGVALSCPLASSTLGISMVVGYKFNDYFKYSFILDIISFSIILAAVPLIYGLTI